MLAAAIVLTGLAIPSFNAGQSSDTSAQNTIEISSPDNASNYFVLQSQQEFFNAIKSGYLYGRAGPAITMDSSDPGLRILANSTGFVVATMDYRFACTISRCAGFAKIASNLASILRELLLVAFRAVLTWHYLLH